MAIDSLGYHPIFDVVLEESRHGTKHTKISSVLPFNEENVV